MLLSLLPVLHSDNVWSAKFSSSSTAISHLGAWSCALLPRRLSRLCSHSLRWTGTSETEVVMLPSAVLPTLPINGWSPFVSKAGSTRLYPVCAEKAVIYTARAGGPLLSYIWLNPPTPQIPKPLVLQLFAPHPLHWDVETSPPEFKGCGLSGFFQEKIRQWAKWVIKGNWPSFAHRFWNAHANFLEQFWGQIGGPKRGILATKSLVDCRLSMSAQGPTQWGPIHKKTQGEFPSSHEAAVFPSAIVAKNMCIFPFEWAPLS